jgi:prepilin-type N-terminal cleavage/methylation domain-containing protein
MSPPARRRPAFTLVELLVVIGIIAILAAILFPVFAQARERARMTTCVSNMRQIGSGLMMYVQDYDETFPYCQFHGIDALLATHAYVWRNAIRPYLKNLDVLGCPSNPYSRTIPGVPTAPYSLPTAGGNAEGWQSEPEQRMPTSYSLNSCAITWVPADWTDPVPGGGDAGCGHDPHLGVPVAQLGPVWRVADAEGLVPGRVRPLGREGGKLHLLRRAREEQEVALHPLPGQREQLGALPQPGPGQPQGRGRKSV